MDPIEVTATATVMIAARPGGKPTPHVVTAAYADQLITALCAAKTACIAGQAALDAAAEALAGRDDGVVDATIHEEWCTGGHDDASPCVDRSMAPEPGPSMTRGQVVEAIAAAPDMASLRRALMDTWERHPDSVEYVLDTRRDTWVSADPAADGAELPAHAVGVCMKAGCGHEAMLHVLEPLSLERLGCVRNGCECHRYLSPRPGGLADGDPGPADPDELCDCAHPAGGHVAGFGRCVAAGCGCNHVVITVIRATPAAEPDEPMPVAYLPLRRPRIGAPA